MFTSYIFLKKSNSLSVHVNITHINVILNELIKYVIVNTWNLLFLDDVITTVNPVLGRDQELLQLLVEFRHQVIKTGIHSYFLLPTSPLVGCTIQWILSLFSSETLNFTTISINDLRHKRRISFNTTYTFRVFRKFN